MNKNIKRIVAIALAIGTVSAVAPATNINLLTTKAYASSDTNDEDTLDELKLETSNGSNIRLYSHSSYKSEDKVESDSVDPDEVYYAKTSSSTISISTDGIKSKYIRVFKSDSDSAKGKKVNTDITLSSDITLIAVRVYSEEPDSSIRYDEEDDVVNTYKIKVRYTGSDDSDTNSDNNTDMDAEDYDDIYLDKLTIAGENIDLSESKINYSYNVDSDIDEVTIKAVPEDEDTDIVRIDGDTVDDDDNYKSKVSLDKGKNEIEIEVENDDNNDERVYTLTITRGSTSSNSTSADTTPTSTPTNADTTTFMSKWVKTDGLWKYYDSKGNAVKNSWFHDTSLGKDYYLGTEGIMATGWLDMNGTKYYLGTDGAKQRSWQLISGKWYYFDTEGRMLTGWMMDITGKYYHLSNDGTMDSNITIGRYVLGADGAWIGR